MDIFSSIGIALAMVAALTLGPLFFYRFFLPWMKKGGKESYKVSFILILINLAMYLYWGYRVKNEITPLIRVLLLTVPIATSLFIELVLLLKNNFFWLQEVNKVFVVMTIPYIFILISLSQQSGNTRLEYEPFLYISVVNLILQAILFFPTFAFLKKENPKIPIGYEIKFGKFDKHITSPNFYKSEEYKQLKNVGLKQLTIKDIFFSLTKYGAVMLFLWLYASKVIL